MCGVRREDSWPPFVQDLIWLLPVVIPVVVLLRRCSAPGQPSEGHLCLDSLPPPTPISLSTHTQLLDSFDATLSYTHTHTPSPQAIVGTRE